MNEIERAIERFQETVARVKNWINHPDADKTSCDKTIRVYELVIEALREKAARENSEPLTVDQLIGAWDKGTPIYAKRPDGLPLWSRKDGVWCVLDAREVAGCGYQILAVFGHNLTLAQSDYGKTWIAYAHMPPKEVRI